MNGSGWADYAYNQSNAANPYSTGIVLTGLSMVGAKMSAYPQIKDAISFLISVKAVTDRGARTTYQRRSA